MEIRDQADQDGFYQAMATDNHLGAVIRAAIYIEAQLIALIEENVASVAAVKRLSLDYDGRINLAIALGLRGDMKPALSGIGTVRNRFAHTLTSSIADADANSLYSSMTAADKTVLQGVYARMRAKSATKLPAKFSSLPAFDRFIICVVTLRGAVISARIQAERARA